MSNATNLRTFCFEYYDYSFQETLCDTRSSDLCILFKFIFLYLWYIPPHSCAFHTFYFTPIFSYVYYHAKYFLTPDDAVARNLISAVKGLIWFIFFFLTFIVWIQWNFPWNISTNLLIFTNKALLLSFNKSESLECAKVVVLKLGAILFYIAESILNIAKIWIHVNRHIPQKINEFPSLALAGRYP